MREFTFNRETKETQISLKVNLDGSGVNKIDTGIAFFDHMLQQISTHSLIDIDLKCDGDLKVDMHHTVEDVGIALGESIKKPPLTKPPSPFGFSSNPLTRSSSIFKAPNLAVGYTAVTVAFLPCFLWKAIDLVISMSLTPSP